MELASDTNLPKQSKRRGRPAKESDQERSRKITVALTESEYQYFKKMAGHETLPATAGPTARPRRRHGSMAGLIRRLMQIDRIAIESTPLATIEQERILGKLANESNALMQLVRLANAAGFLAVVIQANNLLQRINAVLDEYDQKRRLNRHKTPTLNLPL